MQEKPDAASQQHLDTVFSVHRLGQHGVESTKKQENGSP